MLNTLTIEGSLTFIQKDLELSAHHIWIRGGKLEIVCLIFMVYDIKIERKIEKLFEKITKNM